MALVAVVPPLYILFKTLSSIYRGNMVTSTAQSFCLLFLINITLFIFSTWLHSLIWNQWILTLILFSHGRYCIGGQSVQLHIRGWGFESFSGSTFPQPTIPANVTPLNGSTIYTSIPANVTALCISVIIAANLKAFSSNHAGFCTSITINITTFYSHHTDYPTSLTIPANDSVAANCRVLFELVSLTCFPLCHN